MPEASRSCMAHDAKSPLISSGSSHSFRPDASIYRDAHGARVPGCTDLVLLPEHEGIGKCPSRLDFSTESTKGNLHAYHAAPSTRRFARSLDLNQKRKPFTACFRYIFHKMRGAPSLYTDFMCRTLVLLRTGHGSFARYSCTLRREHDHRSRHALSARAMTASLSQTFQILRS